MFACKLFGFFISRVDMTHDAGAGIIGQHPIEASFHLFGTVGNYHLAGMNGVTDSDPAAGLEAAHSGAALLDLTALGLLRVSSESSR